MMHILLWVVSSVLLALFAYLAWFNGTTWFDRFVRHRRSPSLIPLLGGIFGVIGFLILPVAGAKRWWWLPLLLDYGSIPSLLHAGWFWLVQYPKYKREQNDK